MKTLWGEGLGCKTTKAKRDTGLGAMREREAI